MGEKVVLNGEDFFVVGRRLEMGNRDPSQDKVSYFRRNSKAKIQAKSKRVQG